MVEVPADIVSCVVDQLGAIGDAQTLKVCNLTSKTFRLAAQKNIFARIRVIINPDANRVRRLQLLREILMASPNICSYVKELTLDLLSVKGAATPTSLMLLAMLPSIECLSIQNAWISPSWPTLRTEMQSAILKLLSLPTLHTIRVQGITLFPVLTLYRCRHLSELYLNFDDIKPDLSREILAADTTPPIPLERLELVSNSKVYIEPILRHLFLLPQRLYLAKDLVRFTLTAEDGTNMDVVQCIIDNALQHSLTHIKMDLSIVGVYTRHLDLSTATTLESLWLGRGNSYLAIIWIMDSLASLPSKNLLRHVTVMIDFGPYDSPTDDLLERLDDELASLEKFRHAKINLIINDALADSILGVMRYWLPKTAMRDNLTVMAQPGGEVVDLSGLQNILQTEG